MIKDTKPFLAADISLHLSEGEFWYRTPPPLEEDGGPLSPLDSS